MKSSRMPFLMRSGQEYRVTNRRGIVTAGSIAASIVLALAVRSIAARTTVWFHRGHVPARACSRTQCQLERAASALSDAAGRADVVAVPKEVDRETSRPAARHRSGRFLVGRIAVARRSSRLSLQKT